MPYVCSVYAACMQYVCCIHAYGKYVYMHNVCMKVADVYAVCMLYCGCMYSADLMCLYVACFNFCVMKN